ncbi:MAG: hypothetical protein SGJ02_03015 [bacterium]|nr:hypothetical protein [bacterium]
MKPVQYFTKEYLTSCSKLSKTEIAQFLEDFRLMHAKSKKSSLTKLISIKMPQDLLQNFKSECEKTGIKYQTQIKELMHAWLNRI